MSKTKNKNHDEVRFLKGEIRRLQKEIRSLRKENSYHKKHAHQFEESQLEDEEELEIEIVKNGITCDDCFKGIFVELVLPMGVYGTCSICDHRKRLK